MKKRTKLICIDLDNTLIHSDKCHTVAYNKAFKKNGLKTINEKILKNKFGRVGKVIIKDIFPDIAKKEIKKILDDHDYFLRKETKKYVKVIPGAKAAIKKLKKKYKIAIVSNCKTKIIKTLLKASGINKKLFDITLGHDKVEHPKPAPDEILKAEKLIHLKADYMVGDTIYDIMAGKKANVKTIAVLTGNHSKSMLKRKKPYKIIKSIKELPKVISDI